LQGSGNGPLKVKVNEVTVFSSEANRGDEFTVSVPSSVVRTGKNDVRFLTSSPGASFWKTNAYLVSGLALLTEEYDTEASVIDQSFSLSQSKLSRTQEATLTGSVITKGDKVKLKVSLNGYKLFEGTPGASLNLDIPTAMLREGSNTVTWSVERGGKYDIEFARINLDTLDVTGDTTADYSFDVSKKNGNFLIQHADAVCQLYIKKHSGTADDITTQLNQYTLKYHFGASEVNADVCNYLYEGSNSISLSTDDELLLSKLYIAIKT